MEDFRAKAQVQTLYGGAHVDYCPIHTRKSKTVQRTTGQTVFKGTGRFRNTPKDTVQLCASHSFEANSSTTSVTLQPKCLASCRGISGMKSNANLLAIARKSAAQRLSNCKKMFFCEKNNVWQCIKFSKAAVGPNC